MSSDSSSSFRSVFNLSSYLSFDLPLLLTPSTRDKVTAIEGSKDLSSLSLDELISNLKVYEMIMEKDSELVKGKQEKNKSLALKAKKESSDDEISTSGSEDEEYAMALKDFNKFFRRRGKFVRQSQNEKKSFQRNQDDKKGVNERKCFKCEDPNHLIKSQMHNNIMAAGLRDCPPMLTTGRYAQWQSRFMRYVDTKPNSVALKKCILQGLYVLNEITISCQPVTDDSPVVPARTVPETFMNISTENTTHFDVEPKAIHLILTGIGADIYLIIDACTTAKYMWIAIERLRQGESLNKQDVKTNLFWEFGKFTSRDGESIESYYSRFYMNEMRIVSVAEAKEIVDNQVVQQTRIQCFNCKGIKGHFAKECKKPKRAKDYTYHKEKMLMCKQAEKGVSLRVEQSDWLDDIDEDID
nr:serine/threonine protein kinase SRPK1 [Tanacetum cinerariifolium]